MRIIWTITTRIMRICDLQSDGSCLQDLPTKLPRPHSSRPPYLTLEMDGVQSQTEHRCPPTSIDDEHLSRPCQTPSATAKSVRAAEYQEWPLQGFLKRTRIGNQTRFNLEFHLIHLLQNLGLSVPSEALVGGTFGMETSEQRRTSHRSNAYSKTRHMKLRHAKKCIPWTGEENENLVKMKEDGCS
jgi:hypothetical protein